jgi:uncharacterized protein (DUF486 family)
VVPLFLRHGTKRCPNNNNSKRLSLAVILSTMSILTKTICLLLISNAFMLTAWYFHLKQWSDRPWYIAAMLSWFIAAFEYSVHIPANRIGSVALSLPQLQILQVGISLLMFIPFALLIMKTSLKLDYLWASGCLFGAAYFIFRDSNVV